MSVPVLSKHATSLESHVKKRYLKKIEKIGVDPLTVTSEEFDAECLPPVEPSDLFSYLVLTTSFYTNDQFKNYTLEAYNQVVSGFVASVKGKIIAGKNVVVAKVRHSQRMNDPLVEIWIIAGSDGSIFSAHCKAGLAESCSHVASVLFYIECWTRINGKLACMQLKFMWPFPTYVSQVSYAKAKDIDFTSAKKLKENLDNKIGSLDECAQDQSSTSSASNTQVAQVFVSTPVSADEMAKVYEKLNQCETKAVALRLIDPYAEQFISKSRNVAVPSDLYESNNLEYPDLLRKCLDVHLNISNKDIQLVEKDTRSQAKASSFFRLRAGRIGASVCGAVYHTNLAQPSQSLIQLSAIHTWYQVRRLCYQSI